MVKVRQVERNDCSRQATDDIVCGDGLVPVKIFELSQRDTNTLQRSVFHYLLNVHAIDLYKINPDSAARLIFRCREMVEYGAGWPGVVTLLNRVVDNDFRLT